MKSTLWLVAALTTACTPSTPEELMDELAGRQSISVSDADVLLESLQVVDVRSAAAFDAGHIPGALHVDGTLLRGSVDGVSSQAVPRDEALDLFESAGIAPDLPTLVYGEQNDTVTARALWSLAYYGSNGALRLLDGGLSEWEDMGMDVSTDAPSVAASTWQDTGIDEVLRVDKAWMLDHLDDPDVTLFDVRSASEYADGHIPGARNVDWTENLGSDGLFLAQADVLALHDNPSTPTVVVYCQSGARASVSWSLLDFSGLSVRMYDGSWNEWGADPDTPKTTGSAP